MKNTKNDSAFALKNLNKVEGFDASDFCINIGDEITPKLYLQVQHRIGWFRLKFPNGKLVKSLVEVNSEYAIAEARVYFDKDDTDFICNAFACKKMSDAENSGITDYVGWAETSALGRALALAGFGTVFCGSELSEVVPVDSGVAKEKTIVETTVETNVENVEEKFKVYDEFDYVFYCSCFDTVVSVGKSKGKTIRDCYKCQNSIDDLEWIRTSYRPSSVAGQFLKNVVEYIEKYRSQYMQEKKKIHS